MKFILMLIFVICICENGYMEIRVSDLSNSDGSVKVRWKDMSVAQKTQVLEWRKENAEYILNNLNRECSKLKNIPEYTRLRSMHSLATPGKTLGPNDICFSTSTQDLVELYRTLGDYEKALAEMRRSPRLDPEGRAYWLMALISAGHYREARDYFPEFVHAVYDPLTKEEVAEKIKNNEPLPDYLANGLVGEFWDKIIALENKPDDLGKLKRRDDEMNDDPIDRMHRYFYSNDAKKKAAALDYYRENKINLMIEKAHKTWSGEVKVKADKYFKELQKSTTAQ
jgi:tetratricopeptide (TPR) repeat protein